MFKLFLFFFLLSCLHPVLANLNESTKPIQVNIYLEQNPPYSSFDAQQKGQGLLFDYWQQWSSQTGISVKFHHYRQVDLSKLLTANQPAVYSGLLEKSENLENLKKLPLFGVNSQFYYFPTQSSKIKSSLVDKKSVIIVGGLLPNAQQLPLFATTTNIVYREYPNLFDIFVDIYTGNIDAFVLFSGEQHKQNLLEWSLSLLLDSTLLGYSSNELFVYSTQEQDVVLNWIKWGGQIETLPEKMALAIGKIANPSWEISASTAVNILLIVFFITLFAIFARLRRRKDKQFESIFYSSPYPLVIFSLDGSVIYFINGLAESLFPFKSSQNNFSFIDTQHQLLVSNIFNKASHKIAITDVHIRLPIGNEYQDISMVVKRIHYKRHTAWLCYLKDITLELKKEEMLALIENKLSATEKRLSETDSKLRREEEKLIGKNEALSATKMTLNTMGTKLSSVEKIFISTEKKLRLSDGKLLIVEDSLAAAETKLTIVEEKLSAGEEILQCKSVQAKQFEKALFMRNALLNAIFSVTVDPIALLDNEGHVIVANDAFTQSLNEYPDGLIDRLEREYLLVDDADTLVIKNNELLEAGESVIFKVSLLSEGKKSNYEVHKTPFKDSRSDCQGLIIMARDITIRKPIEEKEIVSTSAVVENIQYEQLAHIANRSTFDLQFTKHWQEACEAQALLSALICEIDFFESSNDDYDTQKSDQALQSVMRVLQNICKKFDCFIGLYGNATFSILIKGSNAHYVAENIRKIIEKSAIGDPSSEVQKNLTVSVGGASVYPSVMASLLTEARNALIWAKKSGGDQTCVHQKISSLKTTNNYL